MDSEADWLRRARMLDEDALATIFDTYYPPLYRYLYRHIGHRQTAEDLAAKVFHHLLAALHAGNGPTQNLKAWLFRVATNLMVDDTRRQRHRNHSVLDDRVPDGAAHVEGHLEVRWQETRVHAALLSLTPKQRQVVILRYLNGFTLEEIAQVLALTVGSVKALQHRAFATLRQILTEQKEADR